MSDKQLPWYEHGKAYALEQAFAWATEDAGNEWTTGDIAKAFESGAKAAEKVERQACAQICHERYMELEHGTDRSDPTDDHFIGEQAAIAKELRDKIKARKT